MNATRLGQAVGAAAARARTELPPAAADGLRQLVRPVPPGERAGRWARVVGVGGLVLLAAAALVAVLGVVSGHGRPRLVVVIAAVVVPLALAARSPLWGWRLCWLAALLVPALPDQRPLDPAQLVVLLLLFAVAAARHGRPLSWAMWAATLVPFWAWVGSSGWGAALTASVALTAVAVTIDALSGWHRARVALRTQTARAETEGERRAVLEERARIAREMHDVVAHHLSLIAVRTTTAAYRLPDVSDGVRAEFEAINREARAALADTRDLLGALREDRPAEREPQPALADIAGLVGASRRAGVEIELHMPADAGPLRPIVAGSAYRIVQEALANAARHAPGAAVSVRVEPGADRLCVQVRNASPAQPPTAGAGPGYGLRGMRERAALLDGTLTAGPAGDGGYLVTAVLPTGDRSA